jgi:hypothetical protein
MKRRILAKTHRQLASCRHWWRRPLVLDIAAALLCIVVTLTLSYLLGWM